MREYMPRTIVGADVGLEASFAKHEIEEQRRSVEEEDRHRLIMYLAIGSFTMTAIQFVAWVRK